MSNQSRASHQNVASWKLAMETNAPSPLERTHPRQTLRSVDMMAISHLYGEICFDILATGVLPNPTNVAADSTGVSDLCLTDDDIEMWEWPKWKYFRSKVYDRDGVAYDGTAHENLCFLPIRPPLVDPPSPFSEESVEDVLRPLKIAMRCPPSTDPGTGVWSNIAAVTAEDFVNERWQTTLLRTDSGRAAELHELLGMVLAARREMAWQWNQGRCAEQEVAVPPSVAIETDKTITSFRHAGATVWANAALSPRGMLLLQAYRESATRGETILLIKHWELLGRMQHFLILNPLPLPQTPPFSRYMQIADPQLSNYATLRTWAIRRLARLRVQMESRGNLHYIWHLKHAVDLDIEDPSVWQVFCIVAKEIHEYSYMAWKIRETVMRAPSIDYAVLHRAHRCAMLCKHLHDVYEDARMYLYAKVLEKWKSHLMFICPLHHLDKWRPSTHHFGIQFLIPPNTNAKKVRGWRKMPVPRQVYERGLEWQKEGSGTLYQRDSPLWDEGRYVGPGPFTLYSTDAPQSNTREPALAPLRIAEPCELPRPRHVYFEPKTGSKKHFYAVCPGPIRDPRWSQTDEPYSEAPKITPVEDGNDAFWPHPAAPPVDTKINNVVVTPAQEWELRLEIGADYAQSIFGGKASIVADARPGEMHQNKPRDQYTAALLRQRHCERILGPVWQINKLPLDLTTRKPALTSCSPHEVPECLPWQVWQRYPTVTEYTAKMLNKYAHLLCHFFRWQPGQGEGGRQQHLHSRHLPVNSDIGMIPSPAESSAATIGGSATSSHRIRDDALWFRAMASMKTRAAAAHHPVSRSASSSSSSSSIEDGGVGSKRSFSSSRKHAVGTDGESSSDQLAATRRRTTQSRRPKKRASSVPVDWSILTAVGARNLVGCESDYNAFRCPQPEKSALVPISGGADTAARELLSPITTPNQPGAANNNEFRDPIVSKGKVLMISEEELEMRRSSKSSSDDRPTIRRKRGRPRTAGGPTDRRELRQKLLEMAHSNDTAIVCRREDFTSPSHRNPSSAPWVK